MKPIVTSIRFSSGPARKQPKVGDRRTTKAHGLQIRIFEMHGGAMVMRAGRHRYEWRRPQDLPPFFRHLLTPEERAAFFPPEQEPGYMQQRGAA